MTNIFSSGLDSGIDKAASMTSLHKFDLFSVIPCVFKLH
jgi:hypothetical protein